MTDGRRALLAVLQRTSAVYVAARCGVTPSRVSRWASGQGRPSPKARARLLHNYNVPDTW
jgi:transcriptional regulator with XRE-family HTH domain